MTRFATIVAVCWIALPVLAQDWPEFRGPTGQGNVLKGHLPIEWGPEKNVAWKQPIPGLGWSSPVIAGGKIFLTTAVPAGETGSNDLSLRVLCLDVATGKILWDEEAFHQPGNKVPRIHGKNSHASPTPIVDGERIIVHFGHHGTAALDRAGKILWRNTELAYQPVHGNGGTPVLAGAGLVFSGDGGDVQFVAALDRATGTLLWKTDRKTTSKKKFAFATPLLIDVAGQQQIISPGAGIVAAYEPIKGKEIWSVSYGEGYSVIPRPVFGHGLVFVSSSYDSPTLYAIRPTGQGDATKTHIAWTLRKGAPHTPSPLLVGDELYIVSDGGLASCLDAKTGKIHWQERLGGGYSASPLAADGKVYFQSEEGVGSVVKASREYELVARNELGEKTLASYAASEGALFIRTEKNLYRVGADK